MTSCLPDVRSTLLAPEARGLRLAVVYAVSPTEAQPTEESVAPIALYAHCMDYVREMCEEDGFFASLRMTVCEALGVIAARDCCA
jgi:hypothetical protein